MKNKFSKFINLQGKYLTSLLILLALSIGQMWGAEIFSWTVSSALAKDATETATGGSVKCTGSGMGSETPSSSGFFKFNSSTQLTFTLSSGTFAAGDVISFTFTSGGNNKTVGVEIQETSPVTQLTETVVTKGTSVTKTYTVAASDGIQGQNKFSIKRVDSNFSFKSVSVTSSSGETPVCPSGLTISSKNDQVAFMEGEKIELSAALSAGNGEISYQWYKGSVASGNEISGATAAKYEKSSCTTADAGDYFCVASKTSCDDAVNASAFAITVAADTKCFNMPAITSKPSDLASVSVTGGTLSDVSTSKSVAMNAAGLKLDGNNVYLKVTLSSASIIEGTKITVAWKNAGSGAGIALVNENLEAKVIDETSVATEGSTSHTFTASEAANYADEFIIHRNASGTGIYVNAITVEDCGPAIIKHTITLNYNDGETANGSITVVDGNAAVQPADPTRGKYTFLGWNNGESAYNWATPVTGDITLTAQWQDPWTITFSDGEAAGAATLAAASITVKHNTVADKPADPTWEGHDFNGWKEGDNMFDWTAAVTANHTLVATWITPVAKYDIEYYDGETKLGTEEQVRVDQHPTATGISTDKTLFRFDGWFSDAELTVGPLTLSSVTPVEGLKLYGKWTKLYATSYDMEAYAISDGASLATLLENLTAANYAFTNVNSIDYGHTHNYIYDGMKWKTNDGNLSFNVVAGKLVIVKTGNLPTGGAVMNINGTADPTVFAGANEAVETHKVNYFYSGASDALFRLDMNGSKGTCILKAITIQDPFEVSFDVNGGDAAIAAMHGTPSVTLPTPTKGSDSFLGWFDAETGGNKIGDAGISFTPSKDTLLYAQWEAVSTDARLSAITFSSNAGTLSPAFDPEVVNYTYTMPYPTAAVPTIVSATAVNANAQAPVIDAQAANWGDVAQIHGVAQSGDTKNYYITIQLAPKDGVSIIKVATTGGTNKTVTGLYAGEGDVNLSSSTKMDNGKYIGFTLAGTTLQAGDQINVHTTTAANTANSHIIFYDNMTDKNELYETGEIGGLGDNIFTINAAMVGQASAYVYRANNDAAHQWNGYVDFIEVTRPMNPMLTAITIDGRDGEIDALDDKHFSVTIPYEAVLSSLTVVPTIVRNAAHPTTPEAVISNEGAWILGDNTYRIMDKDGDYTDYTITLDRDVLKHTVSFNVHGGSAVDAQLVVDGENPVAPTAPEKEDFTFQGWAETEDGAIVDVTTFAITADKEFHAIWAAETGVVKLIDGEGNINTTDFITAVSKGTVNFDDADHNCASFSSTSSTVVGSTGLNKFIIYNSKTTQTKIKFVLYNSQNSAQKIVLQKLEEGGSAMTEVEIEVPSKEQFTTDYYAFNSSLNRTMYVFTKNTGIKVLQVKVVDDGTALKHAGEVGYSLNLNQGRPFLPSGVETVFEGFTFEVSTNYKVLNSEVLQTQENISFSVSSPVTMTLVSVGAKYQVSTNAAGDGDEFNQGTNEHSLTAGTWHIVSSTGSNMKFTNISFSAPKCEKPAFTSLANVDLCEGDPFTAINGAATVGDGGTVTYKWYNEDDSEISGATAATFTPSADGKYYVIATNSLAGFADNFAKSDLVTVQHVASAVITEAPKSVRKDAGEEATLTVVASGKNLSYEWFTCDNEAGANPVAIVPAETNASLTVTVPSGTQWYKVVVSSDCGNAEAIAKVEEWVELSQVNVTATTEWDWVNAGDNIKLDDTSTPKKNEEGLMANIRKGDAVVTNDATFNSQALLFYGENVRAVEGGRAYASIGHISFTTTVPGVVVVEFSNNKKTSDNQPRRVSINGKQSETSLGTNDVKTFMTTVPAGEVKIMGVNEDGTGENQYIRISKISFVKTDYTREVNSGRYGTICLPNGGKMYGASLYEVAYKDASKIYFDEILNGEMEAGVPYIFLPDNGIDLIAVAYTDEANASARNRNGLYGSYTQEELPTDGSYYVLLNNQYCQVVNVHTYVGANRAYIKLDDITTHAVAPAPGRRRISMGYSGENTATGLDNLNAGEQPMKVIIDGQLFILRGEQMFDATGRLVK